MTAWAIIPVKPLARAKSRLSSVLTPEERQALAEALLRHVLRTVIGVPGIAGALVISRDTRALALARDMNAHTVQEGGTPELNSALMRATQVITAWRGRAVLILPADLPLLDAEDVTQILRLGQDEGSIVIATDQVQDGTNALFTRPPGLIGYAYGPGSFNRHVAEARAGNVPVHVYQSERLALDVDTPADLDQLRRLKPELLFSLKYSAEG